MTATSNMVKRIPFSVQFTSGEDLDFPASELNTHGPTVQGWRSPREQLTSPKTLATVPASSQTISSPNTSPSVAHEIVLRFQQPASICRIQVLAHQFLIPERIEIWIQYAGADENSADAMSATSPSSQPYEYLGFIALSTNESTAYKSRELQSVSVGPRRGTHLRLRLGAAHANPHNKFNQVALIAVNVIGCDLPTMSPQSPAAEGQGQSTDELCGPMSSGALASMCDDLSFSMYVDESMAELIREMEIKKAAAVNDERFEYARKLKLCMTALRNAGERIGRYALAKRQAVQLEDFITAKLRKEQIEVYRCKVLDYLLVDRLLEVNGFNSDNDQLCIVYAQKPVLPTAPSLQDVASTMLSSSSCALSTGGCSSGGATSTETTATSQNSSATMTPSSPMLGIGSNQHAARSTSKRTSPTRSRNNSLHRRNKSAPRNSFEDYEDRAVPALKHSHTNEFLRECQGAAILENDPCRGRSRLNERERRQAALPILVFGNEMVELFYSRQFQDREEGILQLGAILTASGTDSDEAGIGLEAQRLAIGVNKIARSSTLLLHRAVRDAVFSVFSLATETVRALFVDFVPGRVSASEVARCVDRLLPELLSKCGDPSPRIHTLAQHTILSIAACHEVRDQHLVAPALSRTVGSGTHPRLALSRMQMLEQLMLNQGISADKQSGMTCRTLSECGCSGIHHPSEPVRKVAERILVLVYNVNPRLVRKQLPPDDDITRRNLLYRQLFAEFDKLDVQRRKDSAQMEKQQRLATTAAAVAASTSKDAMSGGVMMTTAGDAATMEMHLLQPLHQPTMRAVSPSAATTPTAATMHHHQSHSADLKTMTIDRNRHQRSKFGFNPSDRAMYAQTPGSNVTQARRISGGEMATANVMTASSRMPVAQRNSSNGVKSPAITKTTRTTTSTTTSPAEPLDSKADGRAASLGRCPFCGWAYSGDSLELDKHFWKMCPMLHKCPQCSQVQEVAALHEHLLNECDGKSDYMRCDRCTEVVHRDLYDIHAAEAYCKAQPASGGFLRCPLCHADVPMATGWREHLGRSGMCLGNVRHVQ